MEKPKRTQITRRDIRKKEIVYELLSDEVIDRMGNVIASVEEPENPKVGMIWFQIKE